MGNGTNSKGVGGWSLPPFYIGQKVVCVKQKYRYIKKGKTYTITDLKYINCCKYWIVTVNIKNKSENEDGTCPHCKVVFDLQGTDYWYTTDNFAPIIERFQSIELKQVTENELASVN